jgi:hypothetical protein
MMTLPPSPARYRVAEEAEPLGACVSVMEVPLFTDATASLTRNPETLELIPIPGLIPAVDETVRIVELGPALAVNVGAGDTVEHAACTNCPPPPSPAL